ncbi:MAG TPA: GAF domain-containing protein [Pseudolabrys sp.]|nr:GAF domain-containing protein [Pseudolabrys sp.]
MPALRRALSPDDLQQLAQAQRANDQPRVLCIALEKVSAEVIGHRLFTVMRYESAHDEVERIFSNMPQVYPTGGRKQKKATAWSDRVLRDMQVFRGTNAADIRSAFDDHETILRLGLGSVLNVPVVDAGRCLGTMNLLHEEGWYGAADERVGVSLAAFLIPVLRDPIDETDG